MAPMLLIVGGITDSVNRLRLVMISCLLCGVIVGLNARAESVPDLIVLRIL